MNTVQTLTLLGRIQIHNSAVTSKCHENMTRVTMRSQSGEILRRFQANLDTKFPRKNIFQVQNMKICTFEPKSVFEFSAQNVSLVAKSTVR